MRVNIYRNTEDTFELCFLVIENDVYGLSHNPRSPQGLNQFYGTVDDFRFNPSDRIDFSSLPYSVKASIVERMELYKERP